MSSLNSPGGERPSRRRSSKSALSSQNSSNTDYRRGQEIDPNFEDDGSIEFVDDDDIDGVRRSSSSSQSFRERRQSANIPLSPPSVGSDDDYYQEDVARQSRSENILGHWHFAPLLIAIVPPLGAVLGGKADAWSDAILLFVASFYLYQLLKVPHDIYHAARTRRILQSDAEDDPMSPTEEKDSPLNIEQRRDRLAASAELKRAEIISLVALVASPVAGAWLLNWLMETFSDGNRYLNTFNIRLFMLASGIKPWSHAVSLLRKRLLHLQEVVHYPSSRVESMSRRLGRIEADLSSLRKLVAMKSDVSLLRDGIDLPLTQLSRTMRRYEKKEEHLRMSAEDKFSLVESRLEDLLREVAINAELIEEERKQRQRVISLPATVFQAIKYALGQRSQESSHRDYLYDSAARTLPSSSAPLNLTAPPAQEVVTPKVSTPSSKSGSNGIQPSVSSDSLPSYSSPPRYPLSPSRGSASTPSIQQQISSSAPPGSWTEEGLAYWFFLPINVPKSVLRSAFSFANNRVSEAGYASNFANMASNGAMAAAANNERQPRLGTQSSTSSTKARYASVNGQDGITPRSKTSKTATSPAFQRRA